MRDDLVERLDTAATLGLDLCKEAADTLRALEPVAIDPTQHQPLVIADQPLQVQVEAERLIDRITAGLDVQALMARCGMDAELLAITPGGSGGMAATVRLYGAGFGASALLHVSEMLNDTKPVSA